MKRIFVFLILVLLSICLISCSNSGTNSNNPSPNPPSDSFGPIGQINPVNPGELSSADKTLAESGNKFGLTLFREIVAEEPDTNIFISPLSVSLALGMTYNGANGETRTAIQQTLELHDLAIEEVIWSFKNLIDVLSNLDPKVIFEIANSIWYRNGIAVKDEFLNLNQTYFNAEIDALDFNNDASCDIINNWVDEKTHGKITEILKPPIDSATIMFLINAIYFKGDWTIQFDPEYTREASFHLIDGSSNKCNMMTMQDTLGYLENAYFQAVDLPYGDGDFSMTIFLPKADNGGDVNALASILTKTNLENWLGSFAEEEILLYMPKFEVEYGIKLKEILTALGMGIAFTPGMADFTNIADLELYINDVRHKTYIKVDEVGTEAAAVTIVEIMMTSTEPPTFKTMRINHPFLFVIREHSSESILFMGKITNPGLSE